MFVRGLVAQQPVAQLAHRKRPHRRKGLRVVRVDNEPRNFVIFIGHDSLFAKTRQRHIGEGKLRGHPLLG